MALTTYSQLQSSIADWLARSDLSTSQVQDCITLFEAWANRRLRTRQMEASSTLTASSGVASLPSDYLAWRSLTFEADTPNQLEFKHPTWLRAAYPNVSASSSNSIPKFFTIEGSTLTIRPVDDSANYTLRYWQKVPALSDSNTSNWLLTAHPDLYLFGALVESNAFVMDEKALLWKQRRDEIEMEIEALSEKTKAPSAVTVMGTVV